MAACSGRGPLTNLADGRGYRIQVDDGGHRGSRGCRYHLTGPTAASVEPFAENLAGMPDNISLGSDGLLWVSIAAPRNAPLDRLLPLPGFLRTFVWNLPDAVRPQPTPIGWVMAFDLDGRLVHDLRTDDGSYAFVTSVTEHNGTVVAGSLHEDDIAVLMLGVQ